MTQAALESTHEHILARLKSHPKVRTCSSHGDSSSSLASWCTNLCNKSHKRSQSLRDGSGPNFKRESHTESGSGPC